jgi:hypothetical protein
MSTVAEIEEAIKKLPPEKIRQVGDWFDAYREQLWDEQIEADAKGGKLDKLWKKAKTDITAGRVKPLDEVLDDE